MRVTRDFWPAVTILAASLFFLQHLYRYPVGMSVFGVSPNTLPLACALLVALLSAALLAGSIIRHASGGISEANTAQGERHHAVLRVVALLLLGVVYIVALPWLGFLLSSAAFMGILAWLFGCRRPVTILAMMILVPPALMLFFEKFLIILLPSSRLFG